VVYIPQQDLSRGVLRLIVREGRVERLNLEEVEPRNRLATAFPGIEGRIFNLRDIEQGLDQINRLRANDAKMEIAPGREPGGSTVTIRDRRRTPWFVDAGADNSGSKSSGERQGFARIEADDLLGVNDLWSLDTRHSLDDRGGVRRSESVSGFLSIPFGYWTASLSADWFDYRSPVRGTVQDFETSGATRTWQGRLERVVHRDAESKTTVSAAFAIKDTFNYVEDTRLETGSRRLAVATVDATHARRLLGGAMTLSLAREAGLHLAGAKSDADRDATTPEAQFEKWTADVRYWHPLPAPGNCALSWTVSAHGQWSPDTLYSTEQLSVGSLYSVRGFKKDNLYGNTGGYVRNDLRLSLPSSGNAVADGLFGRAYVGIGYDAGTVRSDGNGGVEHGRIQGAALTAGTSGGRIPVSVTWARPLSGPSSVDRAGNVFYMSMGVSF